MINDPSWQERYVAALRHAYEVFAAANSPICSIATRPRWPTRPPRIHRPFSVDDHLAGVESLRQALHERDE